MNASIFSKLPPEEITALHQSWKNDPLSVDPLWAAWFDGYELGSGGAPREKENAGNAADTSPYTVPPESAERRGRVNQLIRAYRVMGHQCARFNPLAPPDQTGCRQSGRYGIPRGGYGPARQHRHLHERRNVHAP
jgi:2-oxoglutarate dehydrogenase E1 component